MKKSKINFAALLLSGTIVCAALVGCATGTSDQKNESDTDSSLSQTDPTKTDLSTYLLQIEYYEGLIKDLEARLLNEKEENYIEVSEYKSAIKDLEDKVAALTLKIETITANKNESSGSGFKEQTVTNPKPSENGTTSNSPQSAGFVLDGNTLAEYKGDDSEISVPRSLNGTLINAIGEGAFKGSDVQKITLPDGITHIDWFAFSDCKSLSEIYIPSSVSSIGYGAFDNCSSFLVIKCPKGSYAETYAQSWGILVITE